MFKSLFLISIITLLMVVSWYATSIFKSFPKPTGKYAIGTTIMEFVDSSRSEIYSENSDDKRALVVRFFYPINNEKTHNFGKYPYLGSKMPFFRQYIASQYHLPDMLSTLLLRNINSHSFIDAPLLTGQSYPVIIFSHGGFGFPSDAYLTILENLASHGYIVAAVDHPYFNGLTLFANGKVITDQKWSDQFSKMTQEKQKIFLTTIVGTFKADFKFLIDELKKINEDQSSILYHHLNLDHVVVMGHSAGGTSAIEFCRTDRRCKGAIDLDGWYDHVIGQEPVNKPILLIFGSKSLEASEPSLSYLKQKELTRDQYFERERKTKQHIKRLCSTSDCSLVIIPNATHSDFDNLMFLKWPFRKWDAADPYKTMSLVNGYLIEFLKKYFK